MLTGRFFDVSGIPPLMPYDILETTKSKAITDTCLEKGEKIMTKADEMRKLAAQNQKPKTQKVDYYDEALRNVYFGQFYSDVQYCAQRGDSSGVGYLLVSCVHRHIVIVIMIMEFVWENCMRIK